MKTMGDPRDALDLLEPHSREPGFAERWQAVLRECVVPLLPRLPPEAGSWGAVADQYEQGRVGVEDLVAARVGAWRFHDARRGSASAGELSGLRAVMWRLWPQIDREDWYESALRFFDFCEEAGIAPEAWSSVLQKHFSDVLSENSPASRE